MSKGSFIKGQVSLMGMSAQSDKWYSVIIPPQIDDDNLVINLLKSSVNRAKDSNLVRMLANCCLEGMYKRLICQFLMQPLVK